MKAKKFITGILRVTVFSVCVLALVLWWRADRARARTTELMWSMGSQMMEYGDALYQDTPRPFVLNGQQLLLASGTTTHPMETVLDVYESRCQDKDGGLRAALEAIREARQESSHELHHVSSIRESDGATGFVACIDLGDGAPGDGVVSRLLNYASSHDYADLGAMRYVFTQNYGDRTHFVAVWSEGHFSPAEMFPATGDAPGADVNGVPRPAGRRILSAWEKDAAQSVAVYETVTDSVDEVAAFYRDRMGRDGWTHLTGENGGAQMFERAGRTVSVIAQPTARGVHVMILAHEEMP